MLRQTSTYVKTKLDKIFISLSQTNAVTIVNNKYKIYAAANAQHHTIDELDVLHTIIPITVK